MPRSKRNITKENETMEATERINTEEVKIESEASNSTVKETSTDQTKKKSAAKSFADNDLIECRSIMPGYMNMLGKKSKIVYEWFNDGDITQIEYQDLRAAMVSRDVHVYSPMFIIEDDDVLALPEWSGVKNVYENLYSKDDLTKILELDVDRMGQIAASLPVGGKTALVSIVKTKIDDGTFDSMNRAKKLDEILGTDLALFLAED